MRSAATLTAITLGFAAIPASAQLAPGVSGFSDAPTQATAEEYWYFIRELGYCLAKTERAQSLTLMDTAPDSEDESKAFGKLINRRGSNACMQNMVRATLVRAQVRGAIAEGLYKLGGASAPALAARPALAGAAFVAVQDFADCYVEANYVKARALLTETALGTKAEQARVRDMAPGFAPCLPADRGVRMSPTNVRLALAGALYRASGARPQNAQGSR